MVLGQFLIALGGLLSAVFSFAWGVLLARIVFSWLRPNPPAGFLRRIVQAVYDLTDPVLDRVRAGLPFLVVQGLDLSPIVVFLSLGFLQQFIVGSLIGLGQTLV